jgi:ubiquinone/menaquinone biosynthesis C-methylase UbiE
MRAAVFFLLLCCSTSASPADEAQSILDSTGTKGGFIVHLGCGDGSLTAALRKSDAFIVHGLSHDESAIRTARDRLLADGAYGPVSLERLTITTLPYLDNMVNLIVVDDPLGISDEEIQRVLTPGGAALIRNGDAHQLMPKPRPGDMDDWTHYLHSATGNPVAKDSHVGPPESM